jgi:hypothetical protein
MAYKNKMSSGAVFWLLTDEAITEKTTKTEYREQM